MCKSATTAPCSRTHFAKYPSQAAPPHGLLTRICATKEAACSSHNTVILAHAHAACSTTMAAIVHAAASCQVMRLLDDVMSTRTIGHVCASSHSCRFALQVGQTCRRLGLQSMASSQRTGSCWHVSASIHCRQPTPARKASQLLVALLLTKWVAQSPNSCAAAHLHLMGVVLRKASNPSAEEWPSQVVWPHIA